MTAVRTLLAWVVAIAAFFGAQFVASALEAIVDVPITLSVHSGSSVLDELGSGLTAYGWGVNVLSFLAAIAAWHLAQQKQMTANGRAVLFGFALGSVVLIVCGVPLWKAFSNSHGPIAVLGKLLELALVGVAIFAGMKLTRRLKSNLPTQASERPR